MRDAILGKKPDDIDFATNALPNQILELFDSHDVRYVTYGLEHGTITAIVKSTTYEITTLRIDKETDGRHAIVEFTSDWREDARRRDFTFNALYADKNGHIYDYFNGIEDLQNGKVRFIGSANERICEDYLRILRAVRFYNRFGKNDLGDDARTIKNLAFNLEKISGERIASEVTKTFNDVISKDQIKNLNLFNELDLAPYIFCMTNESRLKLNFNYLYTTYDLDLLKHLSAIDKIALLIKYNNLDLTQIKKRWNLSRTNYQLACYIVSITDHILNFQDKPLKYLFLYFDIKECFLLHLVFTKVLSIEEAKNVLFNWSNLAKPIFPISNQDIMSFGHTGAKISQLKTKLTDIWLESNCAIDKADLKKSCM